MRQRVGLGFLKVTMTAKSLLTMSDHRVTIMGDTVRFVFETQDRHGQVFDKQFFDVQLRPNGLHVQGETFIKVLPLAPNTIILESIDWDEVIRLSNG